MQRPLYMRPLDAIEYGVIDRLVPPQKELEIIDQVCAHTLSSQSLSQCRMKTSGHRICLTFFTPLH